MTRCSLVQAFGYALLGVLTACTGDSTRTVASTRAASSSSTASSTSSPATGKDLAAIVRLLERGDSLALHRSPITARSPEDARRGLHSDQTTRLEGGGVVVTGTNESGRLVVVFDCKGIRYSLASAPSARNEALAMVPQLSAALGCARVSVSGPTECLGPASDPPGCGKSPDW